MRKIYLLSLVFAAAAMMLASCNKSEKPLTAKLTNLTDSASYAMGIMVGENYKNQGLHTLLKSEVTLSGIKDKMTSDTSLLSEEEINTVLEAFFKKVQEDTYAATKKQGEDFLKANSAKQGIITTESGLQYEVIKEGNGTTHPTVSDAVIVNYEGSKIDGTVFDSSYKRGTPATFNLSGVIPGFTEGITLMTPGAKYKFYMPYNLAYGENGAGQTIEPYSTLIFEVELLEIANPNSIQDKK